MSDGHLPEALIVVAHGTADPQGQAVVRSLTDQVAALLPTTTVRAAYVDVQQPELPSAVGELTGAGHQVVVVPLLLSTGFHIEVDVANAVEPYEHAWAARPLGPDPVLADVLVDRLEAAGVAPHDSVVLAAAGSSRPGGTRDAEQAARYLADRRPGRVSTGYGSAAEPTVADAVQAARAHAGRVAVASYLIGPGVFHHRLTALDATVTQPLGDDPRIAQLIVHRFKTAAALHGSNAR